MPPDQVTAHQIALPWVVLCAIHVIGLISDMPMLALNADYYCQTPLFIV